MADIFTDAGEDLVADILDGTTAVPTYYVAWGTGGTTAAKADTTIETESAEARVSTTQSQPASNQNRFVGTITSAGTQTIANAGILSASSGGTLLLHSDFAGVALTASDAIQFTFTITWS